jgi:hypothetical protein
MSDPATSNATNDWRNYHRSLAASMDEPRARYQAFPPNTPADGQTQMVKLIEGDGA